MRSLIRSVSGGTAPDDAADEESGPHPAARAQKGSASSKSPPAGTESFEADFGDACARDKSTDQDEVLADNLSAANGSRSMEVESSHDEDSAIAACAFQSQVEAEASMVGAVTGVTIISSVLILIRLYPEEPHQRKAKKKRPLREQSRRNQQYYPEKQQHQQQQQRRL